MATNRRPYAGIVRGGRHGTYAVAFRSSERPTVDSHGDRYAAVVGPFRTMRAARWYAVHGPFVTCWTVADMERAAKRDEERARAPRRPGRGGLYGRYSWHLDTGAEYG